MRRLSERTKGRVRTAFDDIWDDLPAVRTTVPLAPWIYTFAAFAFLASVFVRRLGLSGTWHFRLPRRAPKAPQKSRTTAPAAARPSSARPADAPPVNTTAAALARVKRGRRQTF
jgi:hypothetical protein